MIKIHVYQRKNKKDLVYLFNALQIYHVKIDPLKILKVNERFGLYYANQCLQEVRRKNGVLYIAEYNNKVVAFIAGIILSQKSSDKLKAIFYKSGIVQWLYVLEPYRRKNIGNLLIKKMENYFRLRQCEYIELTMLKQNEDAYRFYQELHFEERKIDLIKRL